MCGGSVGKIFKSIAPIALPILGSLVAPGLGTALGLGAGGAGLAGSTLSALGGGLGGGLGGAIGGGGVGGALKGAALGGAGGYLSGGGAGELFGGTGVGRALGLANPEGGSLLGNALGSSTEAAGAGGGLLSGLLSGSGAGKAIASDGLVPGQAVTTGAGFSPADTAFLGKASSALNGGGLSSALASGTGGGGSSFSTLGTLLGGANSLYTNDQAQKQLLEQEKQAMAQLSPYTASGGAANSKLSDLLGTSGNSGAGGYGSLTAPFTPGDLTQDPGYQFNLAEGTRALDRKNAASGNTFSGAALKEAQQFGQGLADNTYNNAFQRYQTQNNATYGRLAGQAGAGQGAATSAANINEGIGNTQAGSTIASGNTFNSTLASLLNGSGAKRAVNIGGQIVYI